MKNDLRNKIPVLPINAVHQHFSMLIYGDDFTVIKNQADSLFNSSIMFKIILIHTKKIPKELQPFEANTQIIQKNDKETFEEYHLIYLAIKNEEDSEKLKDQLINSSKLIAVINHDSHHGNITVPTSFTNDDFEIAIHSKGRVDRRARSLKNYLERHTEEFFNTTLVVIGTDHNYLTLDEREPFHLNDLKYETVDEELALVAGVQEYFLLNTCNRVEIYAICNQSPHVIGLLKKIINFDHMDSDSYFIKYDKEAFTHLTMVMSGLLAQIPGEGHIVKQLKLALEKSIQNKKAGGLLQQIFDNSLFISKNVRLKTNSITSKFEIEDIAIRYAQEQSNHITDKTVMIIGTGVVGKGFLDRILLHSPKKIIICYRNKKLDLEKYTDHNIEQIQIKKIKNHLTEADLILSAVSTSRFVIHSTHIDAIKKDTPVIFIDICVPRSIDPFINENVSNIQIVDLETLKQWHLKSFQDINHFKNIGLEEINKKIGRYEKVFDKEWLQEQPIIADSDQQFAQ
ncbi:MAG: hypothetical protein COA79_12475 [Planctomycetota bacterium]|nr:MAG: hypothetical protein COA79_12475 [Planctomycetota bacterium]